MPQPARNELCPCGSGKKYKKCCWLAESAAEAVTDGATSAESPRVVLFSESMLMNRVRLEAGVIGESFDKMTTDAVAHLEGMYGRVAALLFVGLKSAKASGDDLRQTSGIVLTNALKSLSAAFALLRTGWRLQPYACLRNGMEATSVVTHLFQNPGDLQKLKDGRLDSTKTLKAAKAAIPPIGHLYGILSDEFVHVGKPFLHIQKGNVYTEAEWEMWQCLASATGFAFMLYVIAELLFLDAVAEPQCWMRVGETGYAQRWSDEIKDWRAHFVRLYRSHCRGKLVDNDD